MVFGRIHKGMLAKIKTRPLGYYTLEGCQVQQEVKTEDIQKSRQVTVVAFGRAETVSVRVDGTRDDLPSIRSPNRDFKRTNEISIYPINDPPIVIPPRYIHSDPRCVPHSTSLTFIRTPTTANVSSRHVTSPTHTHTHTHTHSQVSQMSPKSTECVSDTHTHTHTHTHTQEGDDTMYVVEDIETHVLSNYADIQRKKHTHTKQLRPKETNLTLKATLPKDTHTSTHPKYTP
eukprot:GHVR01066752.1.p1 GENE.GHVR01066752.1~~GHVR01066752.1.p1  ORF type:complete len:231 (-),score=104.83 GHVR01066752.1:41-733(-)